jgi:phage terminase small subunit
LPPAKGSRRAPAHLTPDSRKLWATTVADYDLADEAHALRLLTLACEALDRCEEARAALAENGTTYSDRFGCPKARPEVAIERDSRLAAARLFRELALPVDDPDDARPPAFGGGR